VDVTGAAGATCWDAGCTCASAAGVGSLANAACGALAAPGAAVACWAAPVGGEAGGGGGGVLSLLELLLNTAAFVPL
jgi:hypothetical protein